MNKIAAIFAVLICGLSLHGQTNVPPALPEAPAVTNGPQSLGLEWTPDGDAAFTIIYAGTNGDNPADGFYTSQEFSGSNGVMTNLYLTTRNYFFGQAIGSNSVASDIVYGGSFSGWSGQPWLMVGGEQSLDGPWSNVVRMALTNSTFHFFRVGVQTVHVPVP